MSCVVATNQKDGRVWIDRIQLVPIKPETFAEGGDIARRHAANSRILRRISDASTVGLERLATILESLTNEQLDDVARYAELLGENPFGEVG